ncbi:leucine-rich repeat transmembrane neuronal protein 2 [Bombina bombina]|uniref:leucine-rich repeat transmembrane neuronal protein 2 n=1 Tax=Bombina bombina TaxID=8345 RepID=UPI00235A55AC|nr:leucine-rich repeat transmembrane neuronal protein 2 [Bombina bombina]
MGLHFKWPLWVPMLAALFAWSVILKNMPVMGIACTLTCRCEKLLVYCDSKGFHFIPNVDQNSLGLSLRHNFILELQKHQFLNFSQLTWLHLDYNQIENIQEESFQGLYKLNELILRSNKISYLPNATFSQLLNLQILDLSFNQLTSLNTELFHGLRKLQSMHLRANSLRTIPVRVFWDCRSLEFLDISWNRIRSLSRNGFAGLIKLRELHLENNHLSKINFAHFMRLISLQTLFLQQNKINSLTCSMNWTWDTLQKLDLTENEIKSLDIKVFETLPSLKILLINNNKLQYLNISFLQSLKSLITIGLSGNIWDCNWRICPLAIWLGDFKGKLEHSVHCYSPDYAQGEDIVDAAYGFQLCWNISTSVTSMVSSIKALTTQSTARPKPTELEEKEMATTAIIIDMTEHYSELDTAIFTQQVITGTMALLFSFFFVVFIVFISRKCCQPTLRKIRQCSVLQNHKHVRSHSLSGTSQQGGYYDYETTPEGPFIIINGYGQCKCQQFRYKECEV